MKVTETTLKNFVRSIFVEEKTIVIPNGLLVIYIQRSFGMDNRTIDKYINLLYGFDCIRKMKGTANIKLVVD